jgi:hypothetical protein
MDRVRFLRAPVDTLVLLRKSALLKARAPISTAVEALIPLLITGCVIGVYFAVSGGSLEATSHLDAALSLPPLVGGLLSMKKAHLVIGVAPEVATDTFLVDSFWAHASSTYGPFNGALWSPSVPRLAISSAWVGASERFASECQGS